MLKRVLEFQEVHEVIGDRVVSKPKARVPSLEAQWSRRDK